MSREIYGYADLESLKKSILSIQYTLAQIQKGGGSVGNNFRVIFAEVTEVVSDNEVKALEKVWDSSVPGYAAPEGTPITFDSDADQTISYNETNIFTSQAVEEGDVIEVIHYFDKSQTSKYLARVSPSASGVFILKITASTDISTYTANIINNRTDETVLDTGVTLKALDHDAGTLPTGLVLTCSYDSDNDVYEPTNYSVAYGS